MEEVPRQVLEEENYSKKNMTNRKKKSVKELISDESSNPARHMPKYVTKKLNFYCPLSPYIMWHRGLQYSRCPIAESERDMPSCAKCLYKSSQVSSKYNNKSRRKKVPNVERRKKTPIPKINKTYHSE